MRGGEGRPFMIETAWCVFTGCPSSGKTSVLERLSARGYRCQFEAARIHIENQLAAGRILADIRRNEAEFQRALVPVKAAIEEQCCPTELVFWDRALPDSISYFRAAGLDPSPLFPLCRLRRYAHVFVFDALPYVQDDARIEAPETRRRLDQWLENDYRALGYEPVRVPAMPIADRERLVLSRLGLRSEEDQHTAAPQR